MKTRWLHTLAASVLLLVLAGCATQRIDWAGRVGNYTYDQALLEYGPPDKLAKTSNDITVAEWLTSRGGPGGYYPDYSYRYGYYYHPYSYYYPFPFYDPPSPDRYLRLTFDQDGILMGWRQLAR